MSTLDTYREVYELYDISGGRGLSPECIQNLPQSTFHSGHVVDSSDELSCSICLQVGNVSYNLNLYASD